MIGMAYALAIVVVQAVPVTSNRADGPLRAAIATQPPTSFTWCGGTLTADLDWWPDGSGNWSVFGWSYRTYNSHMVALRVDSGTVYSAPLAFGTAPLNTTLISADPASATGIIVHEIAGLVRATTTLRGYDELGCCVLRIATAIENLDTVPHTFEWRWYHDTAYGEYVICPSSPLDPDVDGGEVCLPGEVPTVSCRTIEVDLVAEKAIGCANPVAFYSGDDGSAGPVLITDDIVNTPVVAEVDSWDGFQLDPASYWSGFVDGDPVSGCAGDNSVLLAWQVPEGGAPLAPGGSGSTLFYIARACAPTCCVDATPGDVDNTLRMVRRAASVGASWAVALDADTYNVRGEADKRFLAPGNDAVGLIGTTALLTPAPTSIRFFRIVGVSCSGRIGP